MAPSELEWKNIILERENYCYEERIRNILLFAEARNGNVSSTELLRWLRNTVHRIHNIQREFRRHGRTCDDDQSDVSDNSQSESTPPHPEETNTTIPSTTTPERRRSRSQDEDTSVATVAAPDA